MSRLELIPLYSGSSGNSTLIRVEDKNILIDAGRNCKQLCNALHLVGTSPADIDALFITHYHHDHTDAVDVFCRKYPTVLYATGITHAHMARAGRGPHPMTEDVTIREGDTITLGDGISVECRATPHDAKGSVCYKVSSGKKSCMVMTDLGYVPDEILEMAYGVDGILIEANYDQMMLVYGGYPEDLKIRIAGDHGHMSNDMCAETIKALIEHGTGNFILGHLSDNNNTHEKAFDTVAGFLKKSGLERGKDYMLTVANRYEPTKAMVF